MLLINLIIAVLLDKLRESQDALDNGSRFDDIKNSLLKMGFSAPVTKFLIDHELNVKQSESHRQRIHKVILNNLFFLFKTPKLTYPNTKYFSFKIVRVVYFIVNHQLFHFFIFLSIIVNTVIL